jgi:hypothetical protein
MLIAPFPALILTVVLMAFALAFFVGGVATYRDAQSALVRGIAMIVLMVGSVIAIVGFLALALGLRTVALV